MGGSPTRKIDTNGSTLGNLALLTRKKNSAASKYDFDKKKQSYFAQGGVFTFVLTTQVLNGPML